MQDILERIDRIKFAEKLLVQNQTLDLSPEAQLVFDAILYDLLVIGEAAKLLSPSMKGRNPLVPWGLITGMRDILAHEYFRVDIEIIRSTIDKPLENLQLACRNELDLH